MKINWFFIEIYRFSCKIHEKSWISIISQRLLGDRVASAPVVASHLVHARAHVLGLPQVQSFADAHEFSRFQYKSWISTISQRLLGDRVVSHLVHTRAQVLGLPKVQSFADAHEVSRFLGSSGCRSHPHTPSSREWLPLGPHITLGGGFDNSQISQESLGNHENQ